MDSFNYALARASNMDTEVLALDLRPWAIMSTEIEGDEALTKAAGAPVSASANTS